MHRRLAALFFATALALTGCAGSSLTSNTAVTHLIAVTFSPAPIVGTLSSYSANATGLTVAPDNVTTAPGRGDILVCTDGIGNVYGLSVLNLTSSPFVWTVTKYTVAAGVLTQTGIFTWTGNDVAQSMAVDRLGNVYIGFVSKAIRAFAPGATGAATPAFTFTLTSIPLDLATDVAGNLYVIPESTNQVSIYNAGFNGVGSPSRTFTSSALPSFPSVPGLAVDANGDVYVLDGSVVAVFASNATGNSTPVRLISGPLTTFINPSAVAVDSSGTIYVLDDDPSTGNLVFDEFSSSDNGNVAPSHSFTATTHSGISFVAD